VRTLLGNAHRESCYEEALAIRRALAVQNPDVYRFYVADTLNNLGILSADEHRKAEALA
jgi:hypothetical protein